MTRPELPRAYAEVWEEERPANPLSVLAVGALVIFAAGLVVGALLTAMILAVFPW